MKSAYNPVDAEKLVEKYPDISREFALRIYTSQLIGSNPNLVLHGGGNSSIKLRKKKYPGRRTGRYFRQEQWYQFSENNAARIRCP
jgi:rhamnose utilization protein RhaD (predicted bifunctional aldolase and dehydrogenase)